MGSVDIRATKVGEDSSLQKMINWSENRKITRLRCSVLWTNGRHGSSLLQGAVTKISGISKQEGVNVFCPCALALATPVSTIAGIGQATKYGVLIKSGEALERMGKVDCITFDKTGTLTEGNLTVCNVISFVPDMDEDEILHWTASSESHSEHPLGKAIVKYLLGRSEELTDTENFRMYPGKGIEAE